MDGLDILYLDEDRLSGRILERLAEVSGLALRVATTMSEALSATRRHGPKVIVTELEFGEASGADWVRRLRQEAPQSALVLVTADAERVLEEVEPHPAIVSVIEKPWSAERMGSVLEKTIRLRERRLHTATLDLAPGSGAVLLLEDEEMDAELTLDLLEDQGFRQVEVVRRLGDAERYLREHAVSFVVTDLTLPDARGLDAVERLRAQSEDVPIVVLSALDDDDFASALLELGAQEYLVKGRFDAQHLGLALRFARERKRSEQHLTTAARTDPLTGLANREALDRRLDKLMSKGRPLSLLYLDIDRFKSVNDEFGHEAGDHLLQEVADRLKSVTRQSDLLARVGGDEFIVVLETEPSLVEPVARRALAVCREPVWIHGRPLAITLSIGSSSYRGDSDVTSKDLVDRADRAMYLRKRAGRDGWSSEDELVPPASCRSPRDALARRELYLAFQPQWDLALGSLRGFEALIRWHPRGGDPVSPGLFIPALEAEGGIVAVGNWVAEAAVEQMSRWARWLPDEARMSINASPRQLEGTELIDTLELALSSADLRPDQIEVEITETVLLPDSPRILERLESLRALGVSLALDDFGVGFSSLGHLHRYPIDTLKVDRSLISSIASSERARLIVSAIVTLGRKLELGVIAEGVETEDDLLFLRNLGCDVAQGFLTGRPRKSWGEEELTEIQRGLITPDRPGAGLPPWGQLLRVLIVEDEPADAELVVDELERSPVPTSIEIVPSAELGLDALERSRPDLIFLDLKLPGLSGLEFLRKLKSEHQHRTTPVVVLTHTRCPQSVAEAYAAQASAVVAKPVTVPETQRFQQTVVKCWLEATTFPNQARRAT